MNDCIKSDGSIVIDFDKEIYELDEIKYTYNLLKDKCSMIISDNGDKIRVEIRPNIEPKEMFNTFLSVLSNQQIRSQLLKENGKIRDLIVEHAFKPLENLENKLNEI